MLPRKYINPADHWVADPDLPYSQAVRCGEMVFVTGQIDLDKDWNVSCPGDLHGQAAAAVKALSGVLQSAGLDLSDLAKLTVFYVTDGSVDEDALCAHLGTCLGGLAGPGPTITLVPIEALVVADWLIEVEAIAMRGHNGERLARTAAWSASLNPLPAPFSQAIRIGEMIFTSGVTAREANGNVPSAGSLTDQSRIVLSHIDHLLRQLGADLQDTVKTNIFNVEPGEAETWAEPALLRASFYNEPGPAATGISLPRLWPANVMIKNDVIAMRGTDGARLPRSHVWPDDHWDWPVHLPYRHGLRCGDLVFLGGQVPLAPDASVLAVGDPVAQTNHAMAYIGRVLADLGLGFEHVVKINTFYSGAAGEADWKENLLARLGHFSAPGPATTGIPVPWLAYKDMGIEIDIIAMV
jgi:enamine deaminase RidA (YjgF/YER057c/UK114 family)